MTGTIWLLIGLAAVALGAVFSTLHMALREVTRVAMEDLCARRGVEGATRRVERVFDDVRLHAAALTLPRILFNLLVVVALMRWISFIRGSEATGWTEIGLGLAISAVVIWIFGTLVPHAVARHAAEQTVYSWSWLIRTTRVVLAPFGGLAGFVDEIVRRLAGVSTDDAEETREELISVVEEGEREGQFDERERDMIEAVVHLRSRAVKEIMTPRTEIEALEYTDDLAEVKRAVRDIGHSRIPVYEHSLDHIVGVLYAKDMLHYLAEHGDGKGFSLRALLRTATFEPETKSVRTLLADLLAHRVHLAMVADEYGGTSGLVTIEDVVEEVFGDIADEFEDTASDRPAFVIESGARRAEMDARARIDEANAELRTIGVELPESEDYDTVAGLVVTRLGYIPEAGQTLRAGTALLTVLHAEPTRVSRVRVEHVGEDEAVEEGEGEPAPGSADGRAPGADGSA